MADEVRDVNNDALGELRELGVTAEELGRAARGPRVEIPARIDSALRAAARERARVIREGRGRLLRLPVWIGSVAAAAAVLIAVGLWSLRGHTPGVLEPGPLADAPRVAPVKDAGGPVAPSPEVAATPGRTSAMDVDGSGSVDIVDAFLMSRRLREGARVPDSWDFDRDGEVGRGDVEAVAVAAVSL